jgi:UDP-N-acetylmuramoyl-tripeptide--D-alanyl-D-alanine ligase
MKALNIWDVCKAVKGEFVNEASIKEQWIKGVTIDSRQVKEGYLFIPIKGERFDGHDFFEKAYEAGAQLVLTSNKEKVPTSYGAIYVEDTKEALIHLANYYRSLFNIPIIGVTGSVGKTSCKEMLASVLKTELNVHKTQGNYNNDIGLPLTLLDMPSDTEVAVLEMGMNHFGEIDLLSNIAKPNFAIITNIGVSHIENLGSKEGILKAKSEIANYMSQNDFLLLNGDDAYLRKLEKNIEPQIVYFGFNQENDFYIKTYEDFGYEGIEAVVQTPTDEYAISIKTLGKHMLYHALSAIILGEKLGLKKENIILGVENFKNEKMRLNKIEANNGIVIINDSYNASVDSMKSALDVLDVIKTTGRKVAILGDMFELGDYAQTAHEEVGQYISTKNADVIICVGEASRWMYEKAYLGAQNKYVLYYPSQEVLIQNIESLIQAEDTILVKASRGMRLEDTIEKIKEVS